MSARPMISEADLLSRFEQVKRQRDGDWLVTCPAHDDSNPSLHVTRGEDRWLLDCKAGCAINDVLAAARLSWGDLFDTPSGNGRREIVATYDYTDESGRRLYQTVRYQPKDFKQRQPDGHGDWIWNLQGVRRVLFRLPQVLEAVGRGETIYVVEGERDVLALEAAGKVATCNPMGAGKWRDEYAQFLKGAKVVLVADRDEAGYEHAATIARSLNRVASVWTVEAAEGKDARDHLAAGHPVEAFVPVDLAAAPNAARSGDAPTAQASLPVGKSPGAKVLAIRKALLEDAQDTRAAKGPARQEVPGTNELLHRGVSALFFSSRGEGKSSVMLVLGLSAAASGERVLYLDRENEPALTRDRIEGILDANPDWGDPLADGRFVGRHWPQLRRDWSGEDFAEAIAGLGFTVVMFDSLREMLTSLGLDPNPDVDVSAFLSLAVTPLRQRGVAVALADNVGHEETHRPKGSGTKLDAVPQVFKVTTVDRFSAVEAGRIAITCTRSRYGDQDRRWSMRAGSEVWEVPQSETESLDARRARQQHELKEAFRQAVLSALAEQRPLGREALFKSVRQRNVKCGRVAREWLGGLAADHTSGIIFDQDRGYDLADTPPGTEARTNPVPTPPEVPPDPLVRPEGVPRGEGPWYGVPYQGVSDDAAVAKFLEREQTYFTRGAVHFADLLGVAVPAVVAEPQDGGVTLERLLAAFNNNGREARKEHT